jgi:hypothetical protein
MQLFSQDNKSVLSKFFNKSRPDRYEWIVVTVLTTLLAVFLYRDALDGYWRFDDGFHLMFATEHKPWEYFFDYMVTRAQSGANVAPWNAYFYDINLSLFGFEPRNFYLHLLILIIATALALHSLLRLWLSLPYALLGSVLFLLGKPTYHMANEIMSNHYLTGMLFSLLSINFFIRYIRHGGLFKLLVSLLLYALAMTCKEVYVPLAAVLFALPIGNIKQRIIALLPFGLTLVGYAFWRHAVLNKWVGGYGRSSAETSYQVIIEELANIPVILLNDQGWGLLGLIIIAIMSLVALKNRVLNIPLILMSLFIILTPLISLILANSISQPDRYLFLPWVAMTILIATIFQPHIENKKNTLYASAKFLCATLLIISSSVCQTNETQQFSDAIDQAENIYHFVINEDSSKKALVLDSTHNGEYWAFVSSSARHARDFLNDTPSHSMVIIIISEVNSINGLMLLYEMTRDKEIDLSSIEFKHYHSGSFEPFDIKPIIKTLLGTVQAGEGKTIKVTLGYKDGMLSWDLSPKGMAYSAVLWPKKSSQRYYVMDMSESDSYPWDIDKKLDISISFKNTTEGWVGVSPKIIFYPREEKRVWEGKTNTTLVIQRLRELLLRLEK